MHGRPETPLLSVRTTEGDFAHARKRSVRLACCTTTTCCFTLLLGGIGAVAGIITGIVNATATHPRRDVLSATVAKYGAPSGVAGSRPNGNDALVTFARVVMYALGYGIAGLLIGAAVGFGIDFLFVLR